jgi:hypothetical protein
MLPDDTRRRKEAALDKNVKTLQLSVTDHFKPKREAESPVAHSDEAFAYAAIEWVISADLVNKSLSLFKMLC